MRSRTRAAEVPGKSTSAETNVTIDANVSGASLGGQIPRTSANAPAMTP